MTELETLYRKAPRQSSPERLDDMVLGRAAQRVARTRQSLWVMTPLKTLAVSFSVAGLGVALLLRHGVPPLEQGPAAVDQAIVAQGERAKSAASKVDAKLAPEREKDTADMATVAPELAFTTLQEGDLVELPESVVVAENLPSIPEPSRQSVEPAVLLSETVLAESISSDLEDQVARTSVQDSAAEQSSVLSPLPAEEIARPEEIGSPNEPYSTELATLEFAEDTGAEGDLMVAQSQMAADTRQTKKKSRLATPAPRADVSSSIFKQSAPLSSGLSQKLSVAQQITTPPDSARWVLNQSGQSFTLQLATASSVSDLEEYATSLKIPAPLYIVSLATKTTTPNFGLLYGLFDDAQQALDSVETLDSEARRFKPWVRRLGKLQNELLLP